MTFKQGKPQAPLKKVGAARGSGDHRRFSNPNPQIFPKVEFDPEDHSRASQIASYLHRGVKVTFDDETTGGRSTFQHQEGLVDYLKKIVADATAKPVHEAPVHARKENGVSKLELGCSGPRPPTSSCAATSMAFRQDPAARMKNVFVLASERRFVITSRRTICRRRA